MVDRAMDVLIERRIYANPMLNLYVTNRNNVEIFLVKFSMVVTEPRAPDIMLF